MLRVKLRNGRGFAPTFYGGVETPPFHLGVLAAPALRSSRGVYHGAIFEQQKQAAD